MVLAGEKQALAGLELCKVAEQHKQWLVEASCCAADQGRDDRTLSRRIDQVEITLRDMVTRLQSDLDKFKRSIRSAGAP